MYNAGESCDSNPIIASLDPHGGSSVSENLAQKSTSETAHVLTEQSDSDGEEKSIVAKALQQTGRDIGPSGEILQSSLPSPLAGASATKPHCSILTPVAQTETHSTEDEPLLFPLPPGEKDNTGRPQEGGEHSLSGSTMSDHVVSGGRVDAQSPSSSSYQKSGERESHSASPQPTPTSHTEIDKDSQYTCSEAGDGGERRNGENEAQLHVPEDFDSTHLFQLVPKGHHISDETVSVMSNATEEYLGGSSSRDTLSHDRSLTSMIFGARESGDSTSESELSDELGDEHAKKLDKSIEQIQKSYLSHLPPQNSHTTTSQKEEEEGEEEEGEGEGEREDTRNTHKAKDGGQLHCRSIPVHHSHNGMINTDIPLAVPAQGSINMTHESDSTLEAILHPTSSLSPPTSALPTFGILTAPHPSPFLFDGVSSAVSSKRILPSLHPLSNVQLQGELQGLALATTSLTPDPDILTTGLGSSLQTDTNAYDTATNTLVRNKALGRPKEMLPEKFSEVAIADGSDVSHSQLCGTIRENNEPSFPLSLRPPGEPPSEPVCQEGSGEPTTTHTITGSTILGSQTTKPGAFHVATSTQQASQLLLGSALQAAPSETTGSTTPNNHGIPTRDTRDFERDESFKGKPSNENIESNASSAVRVREDSEGKRNEGMNKFDLEMATGSADMRVTLPSQLGEGFDPLQDSEKLPSVATNANLISSPTQETKLSISKSITTSPASLEQGVGGVSCHTTSQMLANNPQVSASWEQQSLSAAVEETKEAVCAPRTINTPPGSTSSALLASLLLSQLESDLNTT